MFHKNLLVDGMTMKKIFGSFGLTLLFIILVSGTAVCQQSLFPEIPGWNVNVENEVYDANNLWDIIDGAADLFLEYSFIDLHTARYINADSVEVRVEVYRHNSPIHLNSYFNTIGVNIPG